MALLSRRHIDFAGKVLAYTDGLDQAGFVASGRAVFKVIFSSPLSTDDALLKDQQLLRRDEIWVAERDAIGASNLLSFSEYKDVRYDRISARATCRGDWGEYHDYWRVGKI